MNSWVNQSCYAIGDLELVSLHDLRARIRANPPPTGRLCVRLVSGDVRRMHGLPENAGSVFQVASQFNLLEMAGPHVTPEQGVTRYQSDLTQGPACAIAAGAATIYRNYFASVAGCIGQTAQRQLDGLADLGAVLSESTGLPLSALWDMRNGYAMCREAGLHAIARYLATLSPDQHDDLRGRLRIGVHRDVEVTDAAGPERPRVTQAFCSALPVGYAGGPTSVWAPFATLVLEAAYEATLWTAALNAQRGASNKVFLTSLGGGAFGNDGAWIDAALRRGLGLMAHVDLDVAIVSHTAPPPDLIKIAHDFGS